VDVGDDITPNAKPIDHANGAEQTAEQEVKRQQVDQCAGWLVLTDDTDGPQQDLPRPHKEVRCIGEVGKGAHRQQNDDAEIGRRGVEHCRPGEKKGKTKEE